MPHPAGGGSREQIFKPGPLVEAGLDEHSVDAAPKLPVPKRHNWSSLVHLHGRISADDDDSNLVLTAADFGRAYLTEQWAARFVTELFREFTVVFVGYRVGDPVMSYMVDALAAERARGARFSMAYAFADHDGTGPGHQKARDRWLAKNVEPILYDRRDDHRLLNGTLIEWARIRRDPYQARSRIALNEMSKLPAGPDDPVVERITWALQDPVAAKALADAPPILDEDDFTKVERWLDMFAEKGLLCCAAADANPGAGEQDPALMRLVDSGLQSRNPQTLDRTRWHLARWMAHHLHVPQLLAGVLRNGSHLHPGLRQQVQVSLTATGLNIPPRLRLLWTILSDHEPIDPWRYLRTSDRYTAAASGSERRRIEEEVIESISPRLVVRPGPAPRLAFRRYFDKKPRPVRPIDVCGHLKLVSGDEALLYDIAKILECPEVLSRHAETLTGHLDQALTLGVDDDDVHEDSSLYRPSIAAHDQNRNHDTWTHLIDMVRDSYPALADADRARGDNLLRRWVLSGRPLFKRLALHALTEHAKSDIHLAKKLLVTGRKPGVWEWELRREVLRFFRLAGTRLPRSLRVEIVRAIHAGPKAIPAKTPPDYAGIVHREKALRLHKLTVSGARLDKRSRALAEEAKRDEEGRLDDRDEFALWHGEACWIREEEFVPRDLLDGSVAEVAASLQYEKIGRDAFRGFARMRPVKALSALRRLAGQGAWPTTYWQGFLWSFAGLRERPKRSFRLQRWVALILASAPDELFAGVDSAAAGFVEDLAKDYGINREREVMTLWMKVWRGIGMSRPEAHGFDDPLTEALNHAAGKLAEAALIRLWKYEPGTGGELPGPVRPYFDAIAADRDGQLGRVMLATRLYRLFAIDPGWVREHLIPRLNPGRSEEAGNLWSAYAWSPTVGPDLLLAFKEQFFGILCDDEGGGRRRGNLMNLFMTICLEAPKEMTAEEIHGVVRSMSEDALKSVLGSLKRRFGGDPAERAQIWCDKVRPWFLDYWPKAAGRNTAGTSEAMLRMLVECGDAFVDAAAWSLPYLRPLEGHGLYRFYKSEQARQHPDPMLRVLDKVVDADLLPGHQRDTLHKILDELRYANSDLTADTRFQRLHQIAIQ